MFEIIIQELSVQLGKLTDASENWKSIKKSIKQLKIPWRNKKNFKSSLNPLIQQQAQVGELGNSLWNIFIILDKS
jgi:hypothetical protein